MPNPKHHEKMTTLTLENIGYFIAEKGVDSLVLSKFFKQVNFSEEQAEAIAEVFSKSLIAHEKIIEKRIDSFEEKTSKDFSDLSSKEDLLSAKKEIELKIQLEIEKLRSDLIKWVAGLMIANTGLLFTLIKFFN